MDRRRFGHGGRVWTIDLDEGKVLAVDPPLADPGGHRRVRMLAGQLPRLPKDLKPLVADVERKARAVAEAFERVRGDAKPAGEP